MIATLGMYDRPEVAHANDAFWALIRENLGDGPMHLTRDMPFWDVWQSPDLLLSQTCGLPFRARLHKSVQLVGTPDYGLMGCEPGYYRSAIVARRVSGANLNDLSHLRLAYNERLSQSGWAAFWAHVGAGATLADLVETGGHLASAKAVADGRADIAALDLLTWSMICKFDGFAGQLEVIALTDPTPGLPYITAQGRDAPAIYSAVKAAIAALDSDLKELLHLRSLVAIPADDYLAIPMPPA